MHSNQFIINIEYIKLTRVLTLLVEYRRELDLWAITYISNSSNQSSKTTTPIKLILDHYKVIALTLLVKSLIDRCYHNMYDQ